MSRTIKIDPITRLEGHGKIQIFLDDDGAVEDCYFQIPELRGFERFVEGRPIEELPRIVTRICGVCPASHHMASAKAVDGCFNNEVAPLAHKLRDMYYHAHYIHSHIAHFFALAAPDFVCGPGCDPAQRNILGVVAKVGLEIGGQVIEARSQAQRIQTILGGRSTHLVWCLPGGVSKGLNEEELQEIKPLVANLYEFTQFSLQLFKDVVLGNPEYVDPDKLKHAEPGPYETFMLEKYGKETVPAYEEIRQVSLEFGERLVQTAAERIAADALEALHS